MSDYLSPDKTAAALAEIQRRGLRSGTPVIRHDPVDPDAIAERILTDKADGVVPAESHLPRMTLKATPKPTSRHDQD